MMCVMVVVFAAVSAYLGYRVLIWRETAKILADPARREDLVVKAFAREHNISEAGARILMAVELEDDGCPNCGADVGADAAACSVCGEVLVE